MIYDKLKHVAYTFTHVNSVIQSICGRRYMHEYYDLYVLISC
jgi:hypothetical protein